MAYKKKKKKRYREREPSPEPIAVPPREMVNTVIIIILSIIIAERPIS